MAAFGRFKYGLGRFLAYWKDVLSSDKGRHLPLLGLSVLLGALLVLLEAYAVSPLYSQWNLMSYDGPYFALMGNEMAYKGAVPYVDFYDIKGPYLFWIEALLALIHPDWGFFLAQCLLSGLSLYLAFLLIRKAIPSLKGRMALLAIYLIFAFAVMEGNVPEDMFLFLPTCAILLCLRLLEKRAISSYLLSGLLEGAIIGFLLFVKASLALLPAGAALFMVVLAIRRKDWKGLAVGVSSGLIGILLLLAVPIAYYGGIGHLDALLEWNLIRELSYLQEHSWGIERIFAFLIAFLLLVYFLYVLLRRRKELEEGEFLLALFLLLFQSLAALLSYVSMRHLRFALPCYVYLASFPLRLMLPGKAWKEKVLSGWAILPYPFLLVLCLGFVSFTRLTPTRNGAWATEALVKIGEGITEEDKEEGNILCVDMPCGTYFDLGVLPEFPYAGYHSVHASQFVPEMLGLLVDYIVEEAEWVLVNDAPYEHPELVTLYSTEEFSLALQEGGFLLREDLSIEGLVLVYERA